MFNPKGVVRSPRVPPQHSAITKRRTWNHSYERYYFFRQGKIPLGATLVRKLTQPFNFSIWAQEKKKKTDNKGAFIIVFSLKLRKRQVAVRSNPALQGTPSNVKMENSKLFTKRRLKLLKEMFSVLKVKGAFTSSPQKSHSNCYCSEWCSFPTSWTQISLVSGQQPKRNSISQSWLSCTKAHKIRQIRALRMNMATLQSNRKQSPLGGYLFRYNTHWLALWASFIAFLLLLREDYAKGSIIWYLYPEPFWSQPGPEETIRET